MRDRPHLWVSKLGPSLVSRNAVFDYRVVVAPQYMIDNKVTSLLAKAAGGDVTEPMSASYREVRHPHPEGEASRLIFRIMEANTQYIGLEGNEALKDQYGRPILLIEGFVVREQISIDNIVVIEDDLLKAHWSMQKDYQTFWHEISSTPTVRPSTPLNLPLDDLSRKSNSEKVLLRNIPAYEVQPKVSTEQ